MSPNPIRRGLLLAFALGFVGLPFLSTAARGADVTVFAAASLKNALDDAAKLYEAKTGDSCELKRTPESKERQAHPLTLFGRCRSASTDVLRPLCPLGGLKTLPLLTGQVQ
jgi:accessory colonization factor AcfC